MNQACLLFAEHHGDHMVQQNLCRNFLLHLISMHDFNLVSTLTIDQAMARLRLLRTQVAQRDRGVEEEEEEEDWETAVESQPDPDPDPSDYKSCSDEMSNGCVENGNQPEEESGGGAATENLHTKQKLSPSAASN